MKETCYELLTPSHVQHTFLKLGLGLLLMLTPFEEALAGTSFLTTGAGNRWSMVGAREVRLDTEVL